MKNFTRLISFLFLALLILSCEKQDFDNGFNDVPTIDLIDSQFQSENFGESVKANFYGVVRNESRQNLEGVQITIGNTITTTDRNGIFILNDVDVFENFAYIKAQKSGYLNGSRVVVPNKGGTNRILIELITKEVTATINSGEFSEVITQDGGKVSFPGNFVTSDGNPYTGQVDVMVHYLQPNRSTTFSQMPGSLFAQTEGNDARNLETYGMISVNLFSPSGQELNIDENSPATIELPVDYSQTSTAPETIDLWYFDEEVGYWKEQGTATKVGDKYIGEVTHFSWWNCDIPLEYINFCFSLSPESNNSNTPYSVIIQRVLNNQFIFSGYVYSGEELECGLIPKDEEIRVFIYGAGSNCPSLLIHQEELGGFSTDTSVEISFTQQQTLTTNLVGTITNCNGNPLTSGYVFIDAPNTFSIVDGMININIEHCQNEPIDVQIFDHDSGQWTIIYNVNLNGGTIDLGSLSTCEDSGGIYNGDITLSNQNDIDNFGMFDYRIINGTLRISDDNTSTSITDLTPLSTLVEVKDLFVITSNESLESLEGLNSLIATEDLAISGNALLTSLQGLDNLSSVDHFSIRSNIGLLTLEGIENLTTIKTLSLGYNPLLNSISALSNLTSLNQFYLENNDAITTLVGLEQITSIYYLWISGNDALEDLNGLENLITMLPANFFPSIVIGNMPPSNFDGSFVHEPNISLSDYCALENLFVNGNGTSVIVYIQDNLYNPSAQDIVNGNCSL